MIGRLELAFAALFWAGNYAVGRVIAGEVSPLALTFLRWVVALALLLPFLLPRLAASAQLVRCHFRWFALMALTAVVLHPILIYTALGYTTATNMTLIIAATPAAILALTALLHRERHGRLRIGIAGLGFLGIATLVWRELAVPNAGDLIGCVSMFVWAFYNVLLRERPAGVDGLLLTTASIGLGVGFMLPLFAAELMLSGPPPVTREVVFAILYVGVFASGIAHLLWNRGIARVGPVAGGMFMNLVPVFGVLLGIIVLGEPFTLRHGCAAALIVASLALSEWLGRRRLPAPQPA